MLAILGLPGFRAKAVENQQCRADGDSGVGHIERRPVPSERMKIEKIHHVAEQRAIPDVAERATQNQRETGAEQALARVFQKQNEDDNDGDRGDADEQLALPTLSVGEKAESRSAIVRKHQIEKIRDPDCFPETQCGNDRLLACLIRERDRRGDGEPGNDAPQIDGIQANRRGSGAP